MKRISILVLLLCLALTPFGAFAEEAKDFEAFDESLMPRAFAVGADAGGAGGDVLAGIFDGDDPIRVDGAKCQRIYTAFCACVASNVGHCYPETCNAGCYGY